MFPPVVAPEVTYVALCTKPLYGMNKDPLLVPLPESFAICCEISLAKPDALSDQSFVISPLIPAESL